MDSFVVSEALLRRESARSTQSLNEIGSIMPVNVTCMIGFTVLLWIKEKYKHI